MTTTRATSVQPAPATPAGFDLDRIRADFPILHRDVNGRRLAYLDNAATTQKPRAVIDAVVEHYTQRNAAAMRAVHLLASETTAAIEKARADAASFVNASASDEIVFVRGVTDAINLLSQSLGDSVLREGDEVVVSVLEHHSNYLPWLRACRRAGATLRAAPITERGELRAQDVRALLTERTRIVALTHASNVIGSVTPLEEIFAHSRELGAIGVVDGAQAASHLPIDVQRLGCDFYTFSGHKMYAPAGIGALYGRAEALAALPPAQLGGGMVEQATLDEPTWLPPPARFEAGSPNVEGAVGLAAAINYMRSLPLEDIRRAGESLRGIASERLRAMDAVEVYGEPSRTVPVLSFNVRGVHAHDVGTILDAHGVAVRVGHLCAQPLMERLGVPAVVRASFGMYNTQDDVDALIEGVERAVRMFE